LGTATIPLAGLPIESFSLPVTVPAIPPGSYYPVLVLDPGGAVVEYDETNNALVGAARFPIGPELSLVDLVSPGGADPGQPITFDLTFRNDGVPYSGPVSVRFIASPDTIYDLTDPVLGNAT